MINSPHVDDWRDWFDTSMTAGRTVLHPKRKSSDWCILDPGLAHTSLCTSRLCTQLFEEEVLLYRGIPQRDILATWNHLAAASLLVSGRADEEAVARLGEATLRLFEHCQEQVAALRPVARRVDGVEFLMMAFLHGRDGFSGLGLDMADRRDVTAFTVATAAASIALYRRERFPHLAPPWDDATGGAVPAGRAFLENFLAACFDRAPDPAAVVLLDRFLIIHAEHGLNTSATVVRSVTSAGTDPFSSLVAGMAAFKGDLHGGASQLVGEIYDDLIQRGVSAESYAEEAIRSGRKMMGFGGRARKYRATQYHEPRVTYMGELIGSHPAFDAIPDLRRISLAYAGLADSNPYFVERKIFPNADVFNGVLARRVGFPPQMNTMLLCFSRLIGWLSHLYESRDDSLPLVRAVDLPDAPRL